MANALAREARTRAIVKLPEKDSAERDSIIGRILAYNEENLGAHRRSRKWLEQR